MYLACIPVCREVGVFLSVEETSNPVFTRGGVTAEESRAQQATSNALKQSRQDVSLF